MGEIVEEKQGFDSMQGLGWHSYYSCICSSQVFLMKTVPHKDTLPAVGELVSAWGGRGLLGLEACPRPCKEAAPLASLLLMELPRVLLGLMGVLSVPLRAASRLSGLSGSAVDLGRAGPSTRILTLDRDQSVCRHRQAGKSLNYRGGQTGSDH